MKKNLYPTPVDDPAGKLCVDKRCIQTVKWKILDSFYCNLGGSDENGTGIQRQGKEALEGVSAGGSGNASGPGEGCVSVDGQQIDDPGQFVGPELASQAREIQDRSTDSPWLVRTDEQDEDGYVEAPEDYGEPLEEFGAEEDYDGDGSKGGVD